MADPESFDQSEQDALARNHSADDIGHNNSSDEARPEEDEIENVPGGRPKKRRRVAKPNPDKKFDCKHEGCNKSYSRAEHLYRHQLNRECLLSLLTLSI